MCIGKRSFRDENVASFCQTVGDSDEAGTEEAFGTIALNRSSDFFPGDKCHFPVRNRFVKKYEKGSVPDFVRPAIEEVEVPLTRQRDEVF